MSTTSTCTEMCERAEYREVKEEHEARGRLAKFTCKHQCNKPVGHTGVHDCQRTHKKDDFEISGYI